MSLNPTLHLNACPLCGGQDFQTVADKDRDGNPLSTVLCHGCGLVFTNPRPDPQAIAAFYQESYRVLYKQARRPSARHVFRAGKVALKRLQRLRPLLPTPSRVLDLGAGAGELLFLLRAAGHDISGIEPNVGYGDYAREDLGLPIQAGGYQGAKVEPASQDLVTAFHVVEHLEDPVDALRVMASWVRPGGRVFIEVPNVLSACQWPSSRFHVAHLFNFTPETLGMAGRRAGLTVLEQTTSEDGGNVICVFERPAQPPAIPAGDLPGHAARVGGFLQNHHTLRHALTLAPYVRPFAKLRRRFQERADLRAAGQDARRLLDQLAVQARRLAGVGDASVPPTSPDARAA